MRTVVVKTEEELLPYRDAWDDLASSALEPNVFYESWMVLPALRLLGEQDVQFVLVLAEGKNTGTPGLEGFFPLQRRRSYKGLPVRHLRLWQHRYCFLCSPLVRATSAGDCLAAFFACLAQDRCGAALVEWPWVAGEGPLHELLDDHPLRRWQIADVSERYTRGLFIPRADAESYLTRALSSRQRKDLRRKEKRLHELGHVEQRTLQPTEDVGPWIEAFLRLEEGGWKGREGTAMAARPGDADFFRAVAGEAFRRGRLEMLGLFLDDRPIALKCNFRAGRGSFAFKIAFDESLGQTSPGYQLEVANIREQHRRPDRAWMDSCTDHEPSMFDELWLDRRVIETQLLSTGRIWRRLMVFVLPMLRGLKRRLSWLGRSKLPRQGGTAHKPDAQARERPRDSLACASGL
jgi:hypothetical protein